jgi:hypothetical protein
MSAELYAALAKANEKIRNASKDGKGNYGAYLTLPALLEAVRGPLAEQGLSAVQDLTDDDERVYVTTRILHASGAEITFGPMSSPRGQNIQHAGAATTYLRRFTLAAALGIAGEDDDDGQSHADQVTRHPSQSGSRAVRAEHVAAGGDVSGPCTPKQVGMINRLMAAHHTSEPLLPDLVGITTPVDGLQALSKQEASTLIEALMALPKDQPIDRSKPRTPDPDDPWASGQFPPDPEAAS